MNNTNKEGAYGTYTIDKSQTEGYYKIDNAGLTQSFAQQTVNFSEARIKLFTTAFPEQVQ
jgi:hypothetical protein